MGVPLFWHSGKLIRSLGVECILVASLAVFALRFWIYANMSHFLHCLVADSLRGASFALFWSTATVHVHRLSPASLQSTTLMILNAMYDGLGQSLGAVIGGNIQGRYGASFLFLTAAKTNGLMAITCATFFLYRNKTGYRSQETAIKKDV